MALVATTRLCKVTISTRLIAAIVKRPNHRNIVSVLSVKLSKNVCCRKPILNSTNRNYVCSSVRQYCSTKKEDPGNTNDVKKLSLFKRFKQMYKDYWYVLVPVHMITSAAWFGGFYYLAYSGVDIPAALEFMNFSEKIVNSLRSSSMGYLAIAYALYKIVTPLRYAVTLGGTTISIQYLKKWGYVKPLQAKNLRQIYTDTKEGFWGKKDNLMESVHNIKESVKETKDGLKGKKDSIVSSVKSKTDIKNIKEKVINSTHAKDENKS